MASDRDVQKKCKRFGKIWRISSQNSMIEREGAKVVAHTNVYGHISTVNMEKNLRESGKVV